MPMILIVFLAHAYVAWRLLPALAASWPSAALLLAAVLLASVVLMPLSFLLRRRRQREGTDLLAWSGLLLMGLFSSLFVFSILRDAMLLVAEAAHGVLPGLA